jgi:hypothetical protein
MMLIPRKPAIDGEEQRVRRVIVLSISVLALN